MRFATVGTAILAIVAWSCGTSEGSISPSPQGGVEGLVTALSDASAPVREADRFDAAPLQAQGVLFCIGHEEVRAYVFPTAEARAAAAAAIDPHDPSHIGTSIVEWTGNPRFWQRDTILVLYLGSDLAVETLLTSLIGPPFARGAGGRGLPGPRLSAC